MGMIRTEALTRRYRSGAGEIVPVREVTLAVAEGEVVFVLGPSGSGKSTLLNLLGALDRPTSGRAVVAGRDLGTLGNREAAMFRRTTIGFVFQSNNLLAPLTALENVTVPCLPDGGGAADVSRARGLLERMGLGARLTHRPAELSGGEQQRVAVARALVRGPRLLLADEPTGALDSETGAGVMSALRAEVAASRMTALIVTHDRRHVQPGDRVLEIRDGRITDSRGEPPTVAAGP